jgi:photosystem II stability/assembly factor-like uncharacterized protein
MRTFLVTIALLIGGLHPSGANDQSRSGAAPAMALEPGLLSGLEWRSLGPPRGGRATAVAGDASNPLVFYFGASHGGAWKTIDAGVTWNNVSDGFFKTAPVGAIDVSLSHPVVVYVGMGEPITRQDITPGDGVYKSTDGGRTWTHVGLTETRHIAKIRIHPTNPDIVYVAAAGDIFGSNEERGVFRTRDGGKNWQHVLYKSPQASAVDLVMDPGNPDVLFASLNHFQRPPWDDISGGPDTGLYKSTDGGNTWIDITRNPGLPKGVIGKIGLALSPSRPNRIWALVEAEDGAVFRSDDSGATWQRLSEARILRRWPSSYMHIVADTKDADTVYIPTYSFMRSTDGGKTFTVVPTPHADSHALWIDPQNSQRMIQGDDGGATVSLNGGASWSTQYNQPTAALFGLAIDDQVPYRLYSAQNDNTHVSTPSRTRSGAIEWAHSEALPGGEGGQTAVKPDGSVVFAADRAGIDRIDRRTGQSANISVWPDDEFTFAPKDVKYPFYYTLPLLLSPHDSNVLYTAGHRVYRTTNEGQSWDAISEDLTTNQRAKMQKIPGGPITSMWSSLYWISLIHAVSESSLQKGELWAGTDDSKVKLTKDGGKMWVDVSPKELPEWTTIATIEVSPHDRGTAYLAAHRYRVSDRSPYFYKTIDYGATWQKITAGIRANDFARVIREDPVRRGLLYAGTETGVYVSFDAGASWHSLQRNLPVVPAQYMLVKDNDLVVATHGRGFWILDNLTPLRQITSEMTAAPAHLFGIATVARYLPIQSRGGRRGRRASTSAGENPPGGAMIDYLLKSPAGTTTLTILDGRGQQVRQFSSNAKGPAALPVAPGLNRFVWDLRYPGTREVVRPEGFVSAEFSRTQAPIAPPGRYTVRLTAGGQQYEQVLEIARDRRITATDQDLVAQFDLLVRIRDRVSEITDLVERVRRMRQDLNARPLAGANSAKADSVRQMLQSIESTLTRLQGPNPNTFPPKALNDRLGALSGAVAQADARPTRQMVAVFDELSSLVAQQVQRLEEAARTVTVLTSANPR